MTTSTMDPGLYTSDPFDSAGPARPTDGYDALVTIAGLGGTGAFLAEDLARLLSVHFGWRVRLLLVDHFVGVSLPHSTCIRAARMPVARVDQGFGRRSQACRE